ncbi:MAG: histidine kinase [Flavobacteriaceae bacterium]
MEDIGNYYFFLYSIVFGSIFIFFFVSTVIYIQSRQRLFLYYSLYNFFQLSYLLLRNPFYADSLDAFFEQHRFFNYEMYAQVLYNSFLILFYKDFLDFEKFIPTFNRRSNRVLIVVNILSFTLFIMGFFIPKSFFYYYYFNFFFLPGILIYTIIALYKSLKTKTKLGYFALTGISIYSLLAFYAYYTTIAKILHPAPLAYYFLGVFLESIVFMVGIGYKIKELYKERLEAQQKIIEKQEYEKTLKLQYQTQLETQLKEREKELKTVILDAEAEKLKSITHHFESQLAQVKLQSLRNQMNPHFIFNALNSIKVYFIDNDKEKAIFYLNKFSKLIRVILESSSEDSIMLKEELDILTLYMSIENLRFSQSIHFTISHPENLNLKKIKVPALLLQPFVENAIWHGLMPKEGKKSISILLLEHSDHFVLQIKDNGIGREKAQLNKKNKRLEKESLGLKLADDRLNFFNKQNHTSYRYQMIDLYDEQKNPTGTLVEFLFDF